MGLLDVVLGRRKLKKPASDRLFAMATAYIALDTELGLRSRKAAGIVFKPLETADFRSIAKDMDELLASSSIETGTKIDRRDDKFGYRWMVLRDPEFEDLVTTLNMISEELRAGGYAERVLCAVFAFEDGRRRPVYWIYNYKRGRWYPFAPKEDSRRERDTERELRLQAAVGSELPTESELERWFPLWGIPI